MVLLGACDVRLGGQGWSEPDWQGVFYPRGLKPADRLAAYATAFDFVEIDSTFYAAPAARTVEAWRKRTPEHFKLAAKIPSGSPTTPTPTPAGRASRSPE